MHMFLIQAKFFLKLRSLTLRNGISVIYFNLNICLPTADVQ